MTDLSSRHPHTPHSPFWSLSTSLRSRLLRSRSTSPLMHHALNLIDHTDLDAPTVAYDSKSYDAFNVHDLAVELLELFPVEHHTSAMASVSRCEADQSRHNQRPATVKRQKRNRRRSVKQKQVETERRRIKVANAKDRRSKCLRQEHSLRLFIRACIREYAQARGLKRDPSILALLPWELQEIMARSDRAVAMYRGFSGQKNLIRQLNEMPEWW